MDAQSIISFIDIALIVAIAQGVFLTVLIFHRHSNLFANRFLGSLMMIFSLSLLHVYLGEKEVFSNNSVVALFLPGVIFLLGPLHYLYVRHLIDGQKRSRLREWLHFLPSILFTSYLILSSDSADDSASSKSSSAGFIFVNWIFIAQMAVYYFFSIQLIAGYSKKIREVFSNVDKIRLSWLRKLTYFAAATIAIFVIENILNLYDLNITHFNVSSGLGAIYVYAMGYIGVSKSDIFKDSEVLISMRSFVEINRAVDEKEASQEVRKYKKSSLSPELAKEYEKRLLSLMKKDQPYIDNDLTIHQLADQLSISTHHLSELINSRLNRNFFDFINKYRVNKVIDDMIGGKKEHLTILGIAYEAGFNSKTTFNTIFKKQVGMTPSAYRIQLKKDVIVT